MFLAVLLPILEPPVPPDSCTFRPRSPRRTAHRFVESPLFISNILECHFSHSFWNVISHIRLPSDPPRSKLKRIARAARLKGLSHPPPPSCHKNPRICRNPSRRFLPSWNCIRARSSSTATNRVCCFCRQRAVHKAFACPKSRFLSKTSSSLFQLPGIVPPMPSAFVSIHTRPLRSPSFSTKQPIHGTSGCSISQNINPPRLCRRGFSFFLSAPPEYFTFSPHRCALHPAPVSRNPESKTHCCSPCSRPFLLPKTQTNSGKLFACRCLYVGVTLSSRAVSSQVLSAPVSLTSVFDMGTGGPSL